MLRAVATAGLTFALAFTLGGAALGETVSDPEHNFRIGVPDGWSYQQNPDPDLRIVMLAGDNDQTGANCNVVTEAYAQTSGMGQAEIDEVIEKEMTEEAWAEIFKAIPFVQDLKIEGTGIESLNGRKGHFVVVSFMANLPNIPASRVKLKQDLLAIPGHIYFITCSAKEPSYAAKEAEFKTVFASFAPLTDTVAANESGAASLTLYAQARFGGVSRIVTRDTPDLSLAGWRGPAGSLSVAGGGLWQVCDGANYAGSCQLIAGARHETITVGSVRRLSAKQASFRMMLQVVGAQSVQAGLR